MLLSPADWDRRARSPARCRDRGGAGHRAPPRRAAGPFSHAMRWNARNDGRAGDRGCGNGKRRWLEKRMHRHGSDLLPAIMAMQSGAFHGKFGTAVMHYRMTAPRCPGSRRSYRTPILSATHRPHKQGESSSTEAPRPNVRGEPRSCPAASPAGDRSMSAQDELANFASVDREGAKKLIPVCAVEKSRILS